MISMVSDQFKRRKVGVLMGGRSVEREISLQSGAAVLGALLDRGWIAAGLDVGSNPCHEIIEAQVELAFIALHGRFGEDGCIQGLLESMEIPYTGSGVRSSALAMDKVTCKRLFDADGLPTPRWSFPATAAAARQLGGFPLVLKPRAEGSSVGLSVVRSEQELAAALAAGEPGGQGQGRAEHLMAEAFIEGHELSVAVLGDGADARALGTVEIRSASGIYDYEAKYARDDTQYLVPAPLPAPLAARISELAVRAHRLLDCRGATRVDFRWSGDDADDPMVLEVNTLPGMTVRSLLPKIAAHAGLSYEDLVETITCDAGLKA